MVLGFKIRGHPVGFLFVENHGIKLHWEYKLTVLVPVRKHE